MNLTKFLSEVDNTAEGLTKSQLESFVREIGRTLPERDREDFLRILMSQNDEDAAASVKIGTDKGFSEAYESLINKLEEIENGEAGYIEEVYNEEYDDWYDNGEDILFEDNGDISGSLAEACDFIHKCMDEGKYKEGIELGERLLSIRIPTDGEYIGDALNLRDMIENKLLYCDLKKVVLDAMYCGYYATPVKRRPERLYNIILNSNASGVSLENLMQHGDDELPGLDSFLEAWIQYLGDKTGGDADKLLVEAVGLQNDIGKACMNADRYMEVHPGIYLYILRNWKNRDAIEMISIGMKALEKIPVKYMVRSKVAIATASFIIKQNERQSLLKRCYFAAFESDTNVVNYLRALLNGFDSDKERKRLRILFMDIRGASSYISDYRYRTYLSEREINSPDINMIYALKFFDGQFIRIISSGLGKKEALGWTGSFMKQGIALYLLALYEGEWNTKAIKRMSEIAQSGVGYTAEEYSEGIFENDGEDQGAFCHTFAKWKRLTPIANKDKATIMAKLEGLIEKRTEGIINANHRNYYGECAAYIAAFGEVKESLGEADYKQKLMTDYKKRYPRRSAFRAEMKQYGWKG
ncbi:MAG: hypothetical protein IJ641_05450 [Lachnospiraceae bacterium]|nr:hypothetical protein [Lachnospiraceae bacterium]